MPSWAGHTIPSRSHPARYTVRSHSQIVRSGASSCSSRLLRGPERALFRGADGRNLVVDPRTLGGRQHIARGRRVEHAERDVGAIGDVAEEAQHTLAAVGLHHRRLDVDDVRAGLLGVLRQVQTVLGRHRRRARLHDDVRVRRAALLDCHLQQPLSLIERQRPELRDAAGAPQHRVSQLADAVAHQRPVGVPVDVVAVLAAERRVERVPDSAQRVACPRTSFLGSRHNSLLGCQVKSLPPSTLMLAPVM